MQFLHCFCMIVYRTIPLIAINGGKEPVLQAKQYCASRNDGTL